MTDTQDKPNRPYTAHRLGNIGALDQPCERHATRSPVTLPRHLIANLHVTAKRTP